MTSVGTAAESAPTGARVLVIVAKAPRAGGVKTRLTPHLTQQAASELYTCLLRDTLALARSLRGVEVAVVSPDSDVDTLSAFVGSDTAVLAQHGRGLAAALESTFARFAGAHRRILAFNSDSPHLPPAALERAFDALWSHDVVVGATADGGFHLVGAKASHAGLFTEDGLGISSALHRLVTRARSRGLRVAFAPPCYDVDVAADLVRLANELQADPGRAPLTAAWLERSGDLVSALRASAGSR